LDFEAESPEIKNRFIQNLDILMRYGDKRLFKKRELGDIDM
jgi:hypothetical protein